MGVHESERSLKGSVRSKECIGTVGRRRWYGLLSQGLGFAMVVLDSTIVNVALPSIQVDLGLSESALSWVVNGYMIPYGGCLLLCGRLGDFCGHRRVFLVGLVLFTVASLGCGIAQTVESLITCRAAQGAAGAAVASSALASLLGQFDEISARAKAFGVWSCMSAGGGSAGLLLGGIATSALGWRSVFFVNLAIGAIVYILCRMGPLTEDRRNSGKSFDIAGALLATAPTTLAIFALFNWEKSGWSSANTLLPLSGMLVSLVLFVVLELRAPAPIVPLTLFHHRRFVLSNVVGALWAAAHTTWSFISTLYLQMILGYDALAAGLALFPTTFVMSVFSLGWSKQLILRFGSKPTLSVGLLLVTVGLALLMRAPAEASFVVDLLPGMFLVGLGGGVGFNSLYLIALSEVSEPDYGVASGMLNSSTVMGASIGLALVAETAAAYTRHLVGDGMSVAVALDAGYRLGFAVGVGFAGVACLAVVAFVRPAIFLPHP